VAGTDKQIIYNDNGNAAGAAVYFDKATGNLGIGVFPSRKLDVYGNIRASNDSGGDSITGVSTSGTGVFGISTSGTGVNGLATNTTGSTIGVRGISNGTGGSIGVFGAATSLSGQIYGVKGLADTSPDGIGVYGYGRGYGGYFTTYLDQGYAGYFLGDVLIDNGNVGIGVANPIEKLEVSGNIKVSTGFDICIDGGDCLSSVQSNSQTVQNLQNQINTLTATNQDLQNQINELTTSLCNLYGLTGHAVPTYCR
jgi:hypothetical protein